MVKPARGQNAAIHVLQNKIAAHAKEDTSKVTLYYSLSRQYWNKNADSALLMADKAIMLAIQLNFEKGLALGYLSKGVALTSKGAYPAALDSQLKSLALSEKLKLDGLSGNVNGNIGIIYAGMNDYGKATEFYERSLRIMEKYSPAATIPVLINLGDACEKNNDYKKALEYDFRALRLCRKEKDGDQSTLSTLLLNLGSVYFRIGNNVQAINYLEESLVLSQKIDDAEGLLYCNNLMAQICQQQGQWKKSIQFGLKNLSLVGEVGNSELKQETYHVLSDGYRQGGDYKTALFYKTSELLLKDSLINIEKEREVNNRLTNYKLSEKQREIDLLSNDKIINENELERKTLQQIIFVIASLFLVVLAVILWYDNRLHQQRNKELSLQKEEITQQKELIIHQNKELKGVNRIKDQLLAVIGHDLRGPLNSLSGFIYLLQKKSISVDEIQKLSEILSGELKLTRNLLENLLTWARHQLEDNRPSLMHFDVKNLIEENLKLIDHVAQSKGVSLINDVQESIALYADKSVMDIVIRNVLSNAVKYCRLDDSVTVSAKIDNGKLYLSIKDTGVGMSEAEKSSVFTIGTGKSRNGTLNEKGAGLGLGLCKELIEKSNGDILFVSELGEGSDFTITVPYIKGG